MLYALAFFAAIIAGQLMCHFVGQHMWPLPTGSWKMCKKAFRGPRRDKLWFGPLLGGLPLEEGFLMNLVQHIT